MECGIANAVLPAGEVVNHARRVAERFNACRPAPCARRRSCCAGRSTRPMRRRSAEGELFAARLRSPEAMEAFQAFFQKRKPDFWKF